MARREADEAIAVEISDTQGHLRVGPEELIALARAVLIAEGRRRATISIALVDQAAIRAINRSHLGHDWPTDVISFPLSDPTDPTLAGELVVSAEMAAATAAEIGVDPRDELALYVVHGLLHLCGYDDLSDAGAAAMRRREDVLLAACGRPNPFDLVDGGRPRGVRDDPGRASLPASRDGPEARQEPRPPGGRRRPSAPGRASLPAGRDEAEESAMAPRSSTSLTPPSEPSSWSR
jgi:probable rRNA maturation factor